MEKITILYEDSDILVCEKPAGVPVQSDKSFHFDMVNRLKNYIYENSKEKKQPYIGLVHRLDRPVGGVMVFAKNSFAAGDLSRQIQEGSMTKKYLAVIDGYLSGECLEKVELENYILKNGKTNLSEIVENKVNGAKKAVLSYRVLERTSENKTLTEITLYTGRHHQIRVQMAYINAPLWGDKKYNKKLKEENGSKWTNIGLYSHEIGFKHPRTKKEMNFINFPKTEPFESFGYIKK